MKKECIKKIIRQIIIKGLREEVVACLNSACAHLDYVKRDENFEERIKLATECIKDAGYLYEELKKYEGGKDVAVGQK